MIKRSAPPKGNPMHITKDDIPIRIDVPGGHCSPTARTSGWPQARSEPSTSRCVRAQISPRFSKASMATHAIPADWGYMIRGDVVVTYRGGQDPSVVSQETSSIGRPATASASTADADLILFSPQDEHMAVMDHILSVLGST